MGITAFFDSLHLLNEIRYPKSFGRTKVFKMFSKLVVRFSKVFTRIDESRTFLIKFRFNTPSL